MRSSISFAKSDQLSEEERSGIFKLSEAVYSPEERAHWPGRKLEWERPGWSVRVFDDSGKLVSHTGVLLREATYEGGRLLLGGIGVVMTHPDARGQGHAARGIGRAVEFFGEQKDLTHALLVCNPSLLRYYSRLGWHEFEGKLLVRQHGEITEFTLNRVMTLPMNSAEPLTNAIDLCGPPW